MNDFLNHWFAKISLNYSKKKALLLKYKNLELIWNIKVELLIKDNNFLDDDDIVKIVNSKDSDRLIQEINILHENQIYILNFTEKEYPTKLKKLNKPPLIIYYKGDLELCNEESIGVIGTRNPTEYGKKISKDIACYISNNNISVISGMAYGIDTYAHLGALIGHSRKTVAVLGNGLLECDIYPRSNIKLFNMIYEGGGLIISEYPIYTKAAKEYFPARNRIIAAISDKIIVVEAGIKSGSFITVDYALDMGIDVYAVPGGIYSSKSIGCNQLIKEGANMLCNMKDIL